MAAVGVWAAVCHAEDTGAGVFQRWVKFIFEFVAWSTRSCAKWATSLHHKTFDHAVEGQAIIKGLAFLPCLRFGISPGLCACGEADEVRDCFWRSFFIELCDDCAHACVKDGPRLQALWLFEGRRWDGCVVEWGCDGVE